MQTTAMVKTGERTLMTYLTNPLVWRFQTGLGETLKRRRQSSATLASRPRRGGLSPAGSHGLPETRLTATVSTGHWGSCPLRQQLADRRWDRALLAVVQCDAENICSVLRHRRINDAAPSRRGSMPTARWYRCGEKRIGNALCAGNGDIPHGVRAASTGSLGTMCGRRTFRCPPQGTAPAAKRVGKGR
jgi:hypothetical protein